MSSLPGKTPDEKVVKGQGQPKVSSFEVFAEKKSEERKKMFKQKPQKKMAAKPFEDIVTINIGIASASDGVTKPVRGKTLPLRIKKSATTDEVLQAAIKKRSTHDRTFR